MRTEQRITEILKEQSQHLTEGQLKNLERDMNLLVLDAKIEENERGLEESKQKLAKYEPRRNS